MGVCPLPATGSSMLTLALLAFVAIGIGVALALGVRWRGPGRGTAVLAVLALGATALAFGDDRNVDAAVACLPPTAISTTVLPTTTTTTTTTVTAPTPTPVADLTLSSIAGPTELVDVDAAGFPTGSFQFFVQNVGNAPTFKRQFVSVVVTPLTGGGSVNFVSTGPNPAGWSNVDFPPAGILTWASRGDFNLAAGATSGPFTFALSWPTSPATFTVTASTDDDNNNDTNDNVTFTVNVPATQTPAP